MLRIFSTKQLQELQDRVAGEAADAVSASCAARILNMETEADLRNTYLDYLFTTFFLSLNNPYITRPTFEEPRCYHCHYPEYGGHAPDCAWLHCRPITSVLYPPPPKPADPDNTTFPAEPTDEPEPEST